jgi:hypothetical protein
MRVALLIVAGLSFAACQSDAPSTTVQRSLPTTTSLAPPVLLASAEPVIRIFEVDGGGVVSLDGEAESAARARDAGPDSISVWSNGRIVWEQDGTRYEGNAGGAKVDALVQRLHTEGAFGDGHAQYDSFGPDAGYDVIEIKLSDRSLRLASWHEAFEANPGLVATDHGIEVLQGRERGAVIAASSPEYQRFRRVWADIRTTVASWIPAQGTPVAR